MTHARAEPSVSNRSSEGIPGFITSRRARSRSEAGLDSIEEFLITERFCEGTLWLPFIACTVIGTNVRSDEDDRQLLVCRDSRAEAQDRFRHSRRAPATWAVWRVRLEKSETDENS
jgi:hypothetical protein